MEGFDIHFFFLLLLSFDLLPSSAARDTITPSHPLFDGQTLVSAGGTFELGFFRGAGGADLNTASTRRFLGIWYHNIPDMKVVWVANRESPINGTYGVLSLTSDGNLAIIRGGTGGGGASIWSTKTFRIQNPTAKLLDSGNLVVIAGTANSSSSNSMIMWQSFDHPANVLLPGMKVGWDLANMLEKPLISWKTADDPSPGSFSYRMRLSASPEMLLLKGRSIEFRSGPWDNGSFNRVKMMQTSSLFIFHFENNPHQNADYSFEVLNSSVLAPFVLDATGELQRLVWIDGQWHIYWRLPGDICDKYGACGGFGACFPGDVQELCSCPRGFEARSSVDWSLRDYSGGCKRRKALACGSVGGGRDGFVKMSGVKPPDLENVTVDAGLLEKECERLCLRNCSCVAFAVIALNCLRWMSGELMDLKVLPDNGGGEDVYIRVSASELGSGSGMKKHVIILIILLPLASIILLCLSAYLFRNKRKCGRVDESSKEAKEKEMDLPLFDMPTIESATNNFSIENKLGEGGFGPVYKGQLADGQEIAVKRLSRTSVQGLDEFMNEVILIAKLQHRNLVRILGSSIEREERMLVYEYMPNKSLDLFIFDRAKRRLLDWQKRFEIILGIARGLLYLHQDSRLKIVHRDLKANNVLLDHELNPKISDFGLARIVIGDQIHESTQRVVGTYGYMSPEYAMHGIFSVKSDVFSFGVILLEIITGKKNREIDPNEPHISLMGHAWRLWRDGRSLELVDEEMDSVYQESQVLRCMQVGLLCVQEGSNDRPTMASVVLMLGNSNMALPQPKRPGFYPLESNPTEREPSTTLQDSTVHEITITMLQGR